MGRIDVRIASDRLWRKRHRRLEMLKKNDSTDPKTSGSQHHYSSSNDPQGCQTNNTTKKPMDLELYRATIKGKVDNFIEVLIQVSTQKEISLASIFFDQETPLQNTYLHVAATHDCHLLVGFILYHFPSLVTARNVRGDTPLHVAARAAPSSAIRVLLNFGIGNPIRVSIFQDEFQDYGSDDEHVDDSTADLPELERATPPDLRLLRETNNEGNTPLHELMTTPGGRSIFKLCSYVMEDREALFYVNNESKSPFYMAVEYGDESIVEKMLGFFIEEGYSIEVMKKGKSPVHAAIRGKNIGILDILWTKMPTLIQLRDENWETPLHCAASIGYIEGVQYLLGKFSEGVFERDNHGFLPVHIASSKGYLDIVLELLQRCPDWMELLTKQGENILHVAAKSGKSNVVDHILKKKTHKLVNHKDDQGNTPLHLAAMNWHPKVVSCLTWDKSVELQLVNHDGMTALDVAEERINPMASFRKRLTWMALKSGGVSHSKCPNVPKLKSVSSLEPQPSNMELFKDRINTLLLVSTLVATVTFAAGFTMPGGLNNSDPDQGKATMLNKKMFQIFVICDAIAMYSSIIVAVSLIWAQLGDVNLVLNSLRLALPLLGIALCMMSLAFVAGVSVVISKLVWLAYVILIMGIAFLAVILALFIPLFVPNTSKQPVLRYISYYFFWLLMMASGSYREDDED